MPCDKVETAKAWRDANVQPRINATEAATMDAPTASPKGKAESAARHRSGEGAGSDRLYWLSRGRREKAEAERAISTVFRLMRDSVLAVPDRLPIDRALAIQLRAALAAALTDAVKIMPPLGRNGVARGCAEYGANR